MVRVAGSSLTADEVRSWARRQVRGSRTPDDVVFVDDLPRTPTGKVIRRHLVAELTAMSATAVDDVS